METLDSSLKHDSFCALPSLQSFEIKTDNINLAIRGLRCDSMAAVETKKVGRNIVWFLD